MTHSPDDRLPLSSPAFLPEGSALRRLPLAPNRKRPRAFLESFEACALVYDCFWDHAGEQVVLVGPPVLNLEPQWQDARFRTADIELQAHFYPSRSTQLIALRGVPTSATEIALQFSEHRFTLPVRGNEAVALASRNVLVTMNKDNDLDWIEAWARWHVKMHGADACIFFDNGSTRYSATDIVETLHAAGIALPRVLFWPYKYGRKDPAVIDRPHYPHFLQVSSLNVALRRFAMGANALLNCDIDELVSAQHGNIFDAARTSPKGIVTLKGNWIEPVADTASTPDLPHLAYRHTHCLPLLSRCANKWALDPSRKWVHDLAAKPSVHRFYDVPKAMAADAPVQRFWHFKAINTGWKESRQEARPTSGLLKRLPALDADAEQYRQRVLQDANP